MINDLKILVPYDKWEKTNRKNKLNNINKL
jgi:hypothetical protein